LLGKPLHDIVYELDPRVKLIWLLSCSSVYFTDDKLLIAIITLVAAAMFIFSGAHRTIYMKAFYYIFIFLIALFLLAMTESTEMMNVIYALTIISKWLAIAISSIAFFVMTKPFELMTALRSFRVPEAFVFSLGIGFRFIPIIFEAADKILMAQKARGLYSGKGFRKILRIPMVIKALIIPLIIEMLNRLWDMWLALMIRGFDLGKSRKRMKLELSASNLIVLIYSFAIMAACAYQFFRF